MSTVKAHVTIDLADVVKAGGVESALIAWAEESDTTSAGTVGPSFSTSGPGGGWSKTHGAEDFATRAFQGGALYYLDVTDGWVCEAITVEQVEPAEGEEGKWEDADGAEYDADDVTYDGSGGWVLVSGEWSDGSMVRLAVPDLDDAIRSPEVAADMARAVIDTHGDCSDRKGWAELVRQIKAAADALEDIDADDLDAE